MPLSKTVLSFALFLQALCFSQAFVPLETHQRQWETDRLTSLAATSSADHNLSRRSLLKSTLLLVPLVAGASPSIAATREPLVDVLYRILRVREATQQEVRLITTGKFKDVQRANVKLAVKFMVENYRLNDAFVTASVYLEGSVAKRVEAGAVGQRAVQNLYTILEYFDSSDVQNLKVCLSLCACNLCIVGSWERSIVLHSALLPLGIAERRLELDVVL
jgi:hypothetical protein